MRNQLLSYTMENKALANLVQIEESVITKDKVIRVFNEYGKLVSAMSAHGSKYLVYDNNKLVSCIDDKGLIELFIYNEEGFLSRIKYMGTAGYDAEFKYIDDNKTELITNYPAPRLETCNTYDDEGRIILSKTKYPKGGGINFDLLKNEFIEKTRFEYKDGKLYQTLTNSSYRPNVFDNVDTFEYDENGNLLHCKNSYGFEITKVYNDKGRIVSFKDSEDEEFKYKYRYYTNPSNRSLLSKYDFEENDNKIDKAAMVKRIASYDKKWFSDK